MKHTLVLIRHAQAEAHSFDGDHSRPLSARGHRQAQSLAARLAELLPAVDIMVYSDARRTQETAEHIRQACPPTKEWADHGVYFAMPSDILTLISGFTEATTAIIVGHEPTVSEVGAFLARDSQDIHRGVPTATALVLRSDETWANIGPHSCSLEILHQR
ncbi:histidine phosphatase family protein [Schaalia sp. Marseille-Q2122]|uniref:SixA phosphatase family protein n=1 Tax=Schaalia sp. Marseille-Q2122 TaxID=2736604 RepID=UPI00158BB702|nr:histidine phosphatase family protein [Schaalia sp. Marseille-Q2122]